MDKEIPTGHPAFRAVNWSVRAWEYTESSTGGGYPLNKDLRIILKKPKNADDRSHFSAQYAILKPTIVLLDGAVNTESTTYHEFGHFMMWSLQGKSSPNIILNPNTQGALHAWNIETSLEQAWIEGWAETIGMIMDGVHHWEDQEYGTRGTERRDVTNTLGRGFLSEYYVATAIYDLWDGPSRQLPPIVQTSGNGTQKVGHNDYTDLETLGLVPRDWLDEAEFSFRDILKPLVESGGGANRIKNVTEYFYYFRDHVIPAHDCQKKKNFAEAFRKNGVAHQTAGSSHIGTLSGDVISVPFTFSYLGWTWLNGIKTYTYTTRVNPDWADYFNQTRVFINQQGSQNPGNNCVFEDLDAFGTPNLPIMSQIILRRYSYEPAFVTTGNPKLRFRHTSFELANDTELQMNNQSLLQIQEGARLRLYRDAKLIIKSGATLHIKANARVELEQGAQIIVEQGGYVCIEQGVTFQNHSTAILSLLSGHILGTNPLLGNISASCPRPPHTNEAIFVERAEYVDLQDPQGKLNFANTDFTWEFYFRAHSNMWGPPANRPRQTLMSTLFSENGTGFQFLLKDGVPCLSTDNSLNFDYNAYLDQPLAVNVLDGGCHHVAVKRQGEELRYYIDGQYIGKFYAPFGAGGVLQGGGGVLQGANPRLTKCRIRQNEPFLGWMGEVRLWKVALPDSYIVAQYDQPLETIPTGLVAHYNFREATGEQIVLDELGISHGQLGSTPQFDYSDPTRGTIAAVSCSVNGVFSRPINPLYITHALTTPEVYPNPFTESLTITIPEAFSKMSKVELINAQGISVESCTLSSGTHTWTPRTALPKGMYLLHITGANETQVIRIIKQ